MLLWVFHSQMILAAAGTQNHSRQTEVQQSKQIQVKPQHVMC